MKQRRVIFIVVPVVFAVVVVSALLVGYFTVMSRAPEPLPTQEIPDEYWRCLACVNVPGKGFHQCKSVMGRGNEVGARERATQRACAAAEVPLESCEVSGEIQCQRLEKAQVVGSRPRIEVVEEPE